ncbi:Ger(x)C family spore germination protein [Shouchella sp. 1P09AA]|uniref:Ger(x)C family spore germination protein n=1 Tax=unclassified Shouchella TaxID=2893065 RepID=UPI0039A08404
MKKFMQFLCMLSLLQLSGCWDSSNIESISFVMGVGIEADENQEETIRLLSQLYLPLNDESMSSNMPFRNKSTTGDSVLDAIRQLELIDQGIMSDHQMILVLGTSAIKNWGVEKLINQKARDERTKSGIKVLVTDNSLDTLFSYPRGDTAAPTSKTIDDLSQNMDRTTEVPAPVTLGLLADAISREQSILLPNVTVENNDIKMKGAYVLKHGEEMGGYMSPKQVSLVHWLIGDVKGGILSKEINGYRTVYEILDVQLDSLKVSIEDERMKITIGVSSDGRLAENWDPHEDAYDPLYLNEMEKSFEMQLKEDVDALIQELQNVYQTDPLNFQQYAKIQNYDFWKTNRHDWDSLFQDAEFDYQVNLSIVDFGTRGMRNEIKNKS